MESQTFLQKFTGLFTQYKGLSKTAYVLFFARLVTSMGAFIFPMMTLILKVKLGYDPDKIGTLLFGVSFIMLAAQLIGGKLADIFNRKKLIITLDIISVLFFFLCAIYQPREIIIVFLVISGFFANMEGPSFDALIAEATLPAEREKVFSLAYLGFNLGFTFGVFMAGILFANYLWLAFLLDGLTTITSTFMIIFLVKTYKHDEIKEEDKNEYENHIGEEHSIWKVLASRKSIVLVVLAGSLGAFIYQQWSFSLPLYMNSIFGDLNGPRFYSMVGSVNGIVVILFTPIMTFILRKKYELQKMMLGSLIMGLSFLLIFKSTFLFLFFIFIFIFTVAEVINSIGSSPYMTRRVPGSHRGRLSAVAGFGYFIGGTISYLIVGILISSWGYTYVFGLLIILGVLESILLFFIYEVDKKIFPKLYITPPSMMKTSIMREREAKLEQEKQKTDYDLES